MKKITCLYLFIIFFVPVPAQTVFKFSFGTGTPVKGYIPVTPQTFFNNQAGYGFNRGSVVKAVHRGGRNPLTASFITAAKPFYFSVKLPEGNYDIKLTLGDIGGHSATTVRVECRRLMLENIRTRPGEIVTPVITVHIRDSLIRDRQKSVSGKIKLKPREYEFLHWDNLLTLEFNDSLPKISAIEIVPNKTATTIFLAGNSTVVDQDREPWSAWGQMLPVFLAPGKSAVANYAESGETLKAFERESRLEKIWSMARPGDYLLIEFAHNDQKPGGNHLDAFTTYKETLKKWIETARQNGMFPILVTSMHRRSFDSAGHIINTLQDYPEAMRQLAREENTPCIDLNAMSKILYEAWGGQGSLAAFVHYPANTFPQQPQALNDNTHFNPYGAYELARCIVSSLQKQHLRLEKFLRKNIPVFDPVHPLPVQDFYWPQSPFISATRPAGN